MIKKLLIFCVFCFLTMPSAIFAQANDWCGLSHDGQEAIVERLLTNRKALKDGLIQLRDDVIYVPVKFHLIADDNGNGRINENKVYEQLCKLNEGFEPYDIQFFIHEGFNYFNSSVAYNTPASGGGEFQLQARKKIGMVNIFIPQNANTGGTSLGTTLGYYSPFGDWIVMRKEQISGFNTTLLHEMGHFLSLPHTHRGWDNEVYEIGVHGNPAPSIAPGNVPTENEARTGSCKNCQSAGDLFCDTPPDYNFGFGSNGCSYGAGTQDPCGDVVDPDESLYMSYFLDGCQSTFSPEQVAAMTADLVMRRNNGTINQGFMPSSTEKITEAAVLEQPANSSTTDFYNYVAFDWSSVDGAEGYLFEIDRFPAFNGQLRQEFVENGTSKIELDDLLPNTTYFWRVQPYNSYFPCGGTSPTNSFTTGSGESTAVQQIEGINEWSVEPNPVQSTNELTVKMNTKESFLADILLYNITGQVVKQVNNQTFAIGSTSHIVDLDGLNNGMYILAIQNEDGVLNEKVVIQK